MTPAEHYREAERWLNRADIGGTSYAQAEALARAQVHATLATVHNTLEPEGINLTRATYWAEKDRAAKARQEGK